MSRARVRRCKCRPIPLQTRRDWIECIHPSGSLNLPTTQRLAELCVSCGGFLRWDDALRAKLALELFRPLRILRTLEDDPDE